MTDEVETREDFESRSDAGKDGVGIVRMWLSALDAASKEEESWRTEAELVVKRYRQEEASATTTDKIGAMAVTGTTTARPTWTATAFNTSYAGLTFDAVANTLVSTTLTTLPTGATGGEIWGVCHSTALVADAITRFLVKYGGSVASTDRGILRDVAGTNRLRTTDTAANLSFPGLDFSSPALVQGFWEGTTQNVNGNGGTAVSGAIATLATGTTRLRIGAANNTSASAFWKGVIRHIFVTTILSASDRQKMEGWMAYDSGLRSVLPTTHPYKSVRP